MMAKTEIPYSKLPKGGQYSWSDSDCMTLEELQHVLEERREQMLEEAETSGMSEELQEEWCELIMERDRVLRELLNQENEQKLQQHLSMLLQLLVTIGQFDHSSSPDMLKAALYTLYKELTMNSFSQQQTSQTVITKECTSKDVIPTPPPLPPTMNGSPKKCKTDLEDGTGTKDSLSSKVVLSSPKRLKLEDSDLEESISRPRSRRRKTSARSPLTLTTTPKYLHRSRANPGSKYTPRLTRTPKNPNSEDLRRCILSGKDNLKSTPGLKRSPGGTPQRLARPIFADSCNPSDILSMALQKKFFNVRRLYGSPIRGEEEKADSREASFNLSID